MDVFELRQKLIDDYKAYVTSFISIQDARIRKRVEADLAEGLLWPEPRIALNPVFAEGAWIDELVQQGVLHPECGRIFRIKPDPHDSGSGLKLHRHQLDAIHSARARKRPGACAPTRGRPLWRRRGTARSEYGSVRAPHR